MDDVCHMSGEQPSACRYCVDGICRYEEQHDGDEHPRRIQCRHAFIASPSPQQIRQRCVVLQLEWPNWLEAAKRGERSVPLLIERVVLVHDGRRRKKEIRAK